MKKILLIVVISFLTGTGSGQEKNNLPEFLVHSKALVFGKTSKLSEIIKSINLMSDKFLDQNDTRALSDMRNEYSKISGIDILSPDSLSRAGIDVSRSAGFAYFNEDSIKEGMMVIIPVSGVVKFSDTFVEIIKRMNADNKEFNISSSDHRGFRIVRLDKDLFITNIRDYFTIASSPEIVKRAIDLSFDPSGTLSNDALYRDYLSKRKESGDIEIFARKEVFAPVFESFTSGDDSPDKNDDGKDKGKKARSHLDSIEYAAAGISLGDKGVRIRTASSLNRDHPVSRMIMGIARTELSPRSLSMGKTLFYLFFSYNLEYINTMCEKPSSFCGFYKSTVKKLEMDSGIHIIRDYMPTYGGFINLFIRNINPQTGKGEFTVYVPMSHKATASDIWHRMKGKLQNKYAKTGGFGEGLIGQAVTFWYKEGTEKIYVIFDKRGIYSGNSQELLKNAMESREMGVENRPDRIKEMMDRDTFFLVYLNNDSAVTGLLKSQGSGNPGVSRAADSVKDIYIKLGRKDNFIIIDAELNLAEKKKLK